MALLKRGAAQSSGCADAGVAGGVGEVTSAAADGNELPFAEVAEDEAADVEAFGADSTLAGAALGSAAATAGAPGDVEAPHPTTAPTIDNVSKAPRVFILRT